MPSYHSGTPGWRCIYFLTSWKLTVVRKQLQYFHCCSPLSSQHQKWGVKPVFSSRLKYFCFFSKNSLWQCVWLCPLWLLNLHLQWWQKRDEGSHPVSKLIKCILCNKVSRSDNGIIKESVDFVQWRLNISSIYEMAWFVVPFCALIPPPCLSSWRYQNPVQCFQTPQP